MPADSHAFPLVANLLCLDFVNTEKMSHGSRVDLLQGFDDLMAWARAVGLVSDADERAVVARWRGTRQAAAALQDAIALRRALRTMAESFAAGKSIGPDVVRVINATLATGASVLQLDRREGGYETRRHVLDEGAGTPLVAVAESAAWLLERGDPAQVRKCENAACILFFYDTTKNKRRRWCSMDACGSRAKAAAYYRRTRAAHAPRRKPRP